MSKRKQSKNKKAAKGKSKKKKIVKVFADSPAVTRGGKFGRTIGSALLGKPGAVIGNMLGRGAGALFKKVTGMGDYKVTSNSLVTAASQDALPSFTKSGRGTRIIHREYLQDIVTSPVAGNFNINRYAINPALPSSFPWLAPVAEQWEEYSLNGVIYEFKSNSYDALASTNTASGTVIMTTQYNVLKPDFGNKQSMEQYEFTCSAKPSVNLMHPVECARGESPLVVLSTRNSAITVGDLRLYDFANFYIATVGMQGASTNIGELWVSYDITLLKPRLGAPPLLFDHYALNALKDLATDGDMKTHNGWFGSKPQLIFGSNLGSTLAAPGVITIPVTYTGSIGVVYNVYDTGETSDGTSLLGPIFITGSNGATAISLFNAGTSTLPTFPNSQGEAKDGFMAFSGSGGRFGYTVVCYFACVSGGTLTFTGGSFLNPAFITAADLLVFSMAPTLV